jgi:hypothetical protein
VSRLIKWLGKDIRQIVLGIDSLSVDFLVLHLFSNEMMLNIDMFRLRVKLGIAGKLKSCIAIDIKRNRFDVASWDPQIVNEVTDLNRFLGDLSNGDVFRVHYRLRYSLLSSK